MALCIRVARARSLGTTTPDRPCYRAGVREGTEGAASEPADPLLAFSAFLSVSMVTPDASQSRGALTH